MLNNYYKIKLLSVFILYFLTSSQNFAQEGVFNLESIDSLFINNQSETVIDVNGEICSVVNITTDHDSIKFYTNLGVEKVVKTDNGYRIWIPSQSKNLKLLVPGFPLMEYLFPGSPFKIPVYNITLDIKYYQQIVYKDTLRKSLSLTTSPARAKVYINNKFIKRSPVFISEPDFNTFEYSVKKRACESFHAKDTFNTKTKSISVSLNSLYKTSRYFLLMSVKSEGALNGGISNISALSDIPIISISFGSYGKTGYYGSVGYIQGMRTGSYPGDYDKATKASGIFGINQQIGKSIFVYGGPGYTYRYYKVRSSYEDIYLFTSEQEEDLSSVNLNMGIIFRIGWYFLFQIDSSLGINRPYWSVGYGIGINLRKKPVRSN